MAYLTGNHTDPTRSPRYETPTFDPRCAFSWTLRGGEIARLEARQQNGRLDGTTLESTEPEVAQVDHGETIVARSPQYETPTFDPRSAFSWTMRAGEMARIERQQRRSRLSDPRQLDVRVAA